MVTKHYFTYNELETSLLVLPTSTTELTLRAFHGHVEGMILLEFSVIHAELNIWWYVKQSYSCEIGE